MKKFSKVLAMITVMLLGLTSTGVTAYAGNPTPTPTPTTPPTPGVDSKYEPQKGEKAVKFKKYLISELGHEVPDLSFTYKIEGGKAIPSTPFKPAEPETWEFDGETFEEHQEAINSARAAVIEVPGDPTTWEYNGDTFYTLEEAWLEAEGDIIHHDAVPEEGEHFEVYAGIDADKITITTADFTDSAPDKYGVVQEGDTVKLEGAEVYQKREVVINFEAVKFEEPGIYRYKLTEEEIPDQLRLEYDTQRSDPESTRKVRFIDVYVVDDGNGNLVIENTTVMHEIETTVYTTAQMGSLDEKATVEIMWDLPELPDDLPNNYKTKYSPYINNDYAEYNAAEDDRAELSKEIHTDILAENDKIKAGSQLQQELEALEEALEQAKNSCGCR